MARVRRGRGNRSCLECGEVFPYHDGIALGRTYLCSVECRDVRDVKRSLGQSQVARASAPGSVRRGALLRRGDALWLVTVASIQPGLRGYGDTKTEIVLRRVNAQNLPGHTIHDITCNDWYQT